MYVCILSLKHKKKVPKSLLLGGGMRSACYWLPYLAYPTLPYTVQHSIAYRVRKAEAPRRIHVAKRYLPINILGPARVRITYTYIPYTYMIHTRVCKRITLCLITLLYLPDLPYMPYTKTGRFPYSSLLPDEIYYTKVLHYYTCTIR